ncbi:MAG: hydroxymethylbilane synthase [bacterium]
MKKIIIGSRGSKLALAQANEAALQLKKLCQNTQISIKIIKTKGDKIIDVPLAKIGGKGLFIKELEEALLRKEIDMAVHSMTDVPIELHSGLMIGAITKRIDPRDTLISKDFKLLNELPSGAVIGTSSLRRKVQLTYYRNDLKIIDLRGNLDTRIRKLTSQSELQAIIVALAGLLRMGWEGKITQVLSTDIILPPAGQGVLGIEIREDDAKIKEIKEIIGNLNDEESYWAVTGERAFLKKLGGGCQIPVGVLGCLQCEILKLEGMVEGKKRRCN